MLLNKTEIDKLWQAFGIFDTDNVKIVRTIAEPHRTPRFN
jgi:hypothetical protein